MLAAQQTPDSPSWFEGTADAVRKYLRLFAEWDVDEYLILAGDHLYRMNYADFVQRHRETKADITLAVVPVARGGSDFGLLRIDHHGRVRGFSEKPTGAALHAMQVDTTLFGLSAEQAQAAPYTASMGIYVFAKQVLHDLLTQSRRTRILAKMSSRPRRARTMCRRICSRIIGKISGRLRHFTTPIWR